MGKLDGKVALVTGSGRNIGRATVLKLAAEGAHVVVNSRTNKAEADAVAQEVRAGGGKALSLLADVSKKEQVDSMMSRALSEFGRIDILINNAAIRPHKPFTELTLQDWEEVRGVVLDGAFYCIRAVIHSMVANQYGRILSTAPEPAWDVYLVFGKSVRWKGADPPHPDFWMQQLVAAQGKAPHLDGAVFAKEVARLLGS